MSFLKPRARQPRAPQRRRGARGSVTVILTLVLVPVGRAPDDAAGSGAVVAGPLEAGADVVDGLQALADQHRGERVVIPVDPAQLTAVLEHLGRAPRATEVVVLEIGDDGWALLPGQG